MTRILILGGGGMVGQKLADRLGPDVDLTLFDIAFPTPSAQGQQLIGSITDPGTVQQLANARYDVIYHLAAIVSGEAETDFDKGWQVNTMSMWMLLEALRNEHQDSGGTYVPRLIFTSSIAVFGAPFPEKIGDEFLSAPQTSYGAQKATCELMLSDMSRKGFIDGLSLRLPTICVRPGKPNAAASGFFSGIIREPLNGQTAVLPVSDDVRHWHASPRSAAGFLTHALTLDTDRLKGRRALNLPGISVTVAEQIEALRRVAGQHAIDLIQYRPDPAVIAIVAGWPRDFNPARAQALGFESETSFDDIIRVYLEDDLPKVSA